MRKALLTAMILFVITPLPSVWGEVNFAVSDPDDGEHLLYVSSVGLTWTASADSYEDLTDITSGSGTGDIAAVLDATAPDHDGEITWVTGSNSITYNLAEGDKTMFSFMFGVLGSVFFWVAYFGVSVFAAVAVFKKVSPRKWSYLKSGNYDSDDVVPFVITILFWPIVLAAVVVGWVIKHCIWGLLLKAVFAADNLMPEVSFKKKPPQED